VEGTSLGFAKENYTGHLERALEALAAGREEPEAYFIAAFSWRILGLCHLLERADRGAFQGCLARAGQTRLAFLNKVRGGLSSPPAFLAASKDLPFTASLAAGDLETARGIATLSPREHFEGVEYEDDFLFFHSLHRLVLDATDEPSNRALLARWEELLQGEPSGPFRVCRALLEHAPEEFPGAFQAYLTWQEGVLEEYQARVSYDEELFATEGQISVEGLALLRLAELRGITVLQDYPRIPSLARVSQGVPLPGPDAWRKA
jgi:hypothetical protein